MQGVPKKKRLEREISPAAKELATLRCSVNGSTKLQEGIRSQSYLSEKDLKTGKGTTP